MPSLESLSAFMALILLPSSAPTVLAGPPAGQGALDWFILYLPYVLGIIALIVLILYSMREEKKT